MLKLWQHKTTGYVKIQRLCPSQEYDEIIGIDGKYLQIPNNLILGLLQSDSVIVGEVERDANNRHL